MSPNTTEIAAYVDALKRIYEAAKPPCHSKAQRVAYQIARDTLKAWGRIK